MPRRTFLSTDAEWWRKHLTGVITQDFFLACLSFHNTLLTIGKLVGLNNVAVAGNINSVSNMRPLWAILIFGAIATSGVLLALVVYFVWSTEVRYVFISRGTSRVCLRKICCDNIDVRSNSRNIDYNECCVVIYTCKTISHSLWICIISYLLLCLVYSSCMAFFWEAVSRLSLCKPEMTH